MSEPTFTPGPWGWCMPDEVFPAVFCNENGNIIADLYDAKNNQRQMVANAALIAAAPEMYEALEFSKREFHDLHLEKYCEYIEIVLKKARGEK